MYIYICIYVCLCLFVYFVYICVFLVGFVSWAVQGQKVFEVLIDDFEGCLYLASCVGFFFEFVGELYYLVDRSSLVIVLVLIVDFGQRDCGFLFFLVRFLVQSFVSFFREFRGFSFSNVFFGFFVGRVTTWIFFQRCWCIFCFVYVVRGYGSVSFCISFNFLCGFVCFKVWRGSFELIVSCVLVRGMRGYYFCF